MGFAVLYNFQPDVQDVSNLLLLITHQILALTMTMGCPGRRDVDTLKRFSTLL